MTRANYLSDRNEEIIDIYEKSYEEQHKVFSGFLLYIKRGKGLCGNEQKVLRHG